MNKTAIKEFAVTARKKLIASVKDKAGKIGITEDSITTAITTGSGFAVFPTHFGTETKLAGKELVQRENLICQIKEKGYNTVIEEVAYTWFNRIIAIRFMEVNDYLPTRVRVLSSETKDKFEPDLVTQAPYIELDLTPAEKDEILSFKMKNDLDNLFRMLLIRQCNALGEILPELFENTSTANRHYTEILLDISYTKEESIIRDLLKIDEADFLDAVEIIGWMYQYYNTEPKDETFALLKKNVKITKERIPSATQLFTPDWIVRYMVENSLGRLWLEHCQAEAGRSNEHKNASYFGWKYYLEEAEQEPEVLIQLEILRQDAKNLNPEDIKVIDPCMGSGHILVYAFEVLMQIYESCGYTQRDAAKLIIEKNLYGLDIDDRAFQLAYFAVMMKGRKYNRRILTSGIQTNLCGIQESNAIKPELINFIADGNESIFHDTQALINEFIDAKEYGSILEMPEIDFVGLSKRVNEINEAVYDNIIERISQDDVRNHLIPLLKQAEILTEKYDAVITNPPYMGSSGMGSKLGDYVKKYYPDSKSDMFAVFTQKCKTFSKNKGYYSLITQPSILFLSSFEKLRKAIMLNQTISSLLHMGRGIFGIDFGSVAFVIKNYNLKKHAGCYFRLHERTFQYVDSDDIAKLYLLAKGNSDFKFNFSAYQTNNVLIDNNESERSNKELRIYYETNQENFEKIPGMPIAYWVDEKLIEAFEIDKSLDSIAKPRKGLTTANDEVFLRFWHEVSLKKVSLRFCGEEKETEGNKKWYPINKGGEYRKWYGNNVHIINWENDGCELKNYKNAVIRNIDYYFKNSITWNDITSKKISFRLKDSGQIFNDAGPSIFGSSDDLRYLLGFGNSIVSEEICKIIAPTIHYGVGQIAKLPVKNSHKFKFKVLTLTNENVEFAKIDWDSFETSWDFKIHPLVMLKMSGASAWGDQDPKCRISIAFKAWELLTDGQFTQLKANEEELNRIFIEIYGLADELTPEVDDKDVTIRKADLGRDIRSLISYAVGCMLGRYSLDTPGLAYAGGDWEVDKYTTIIPDTDNIIPITDAEYFDDDMVARLVSFVKEVYGEATLEENLDFIAGALGNKGNTAREVIRNYFLKDFYKDHLKIYQKRPIYWLFDSGKENGLKTLIYMHRYDQDTVGRVRTDYLHKIQAKLEDIINHCNVILASEAPAGEKAAAVKKKEKLIKQLAETRLYDQAIAHIALSRLAIDLDDGVKVNYAKFQDVEVASEGKKAVKVNLLAKI